MLRKKTLITLSIITIFLLAFLMAALAVKYTYHHGFLKNCYRVCYYNKNAKIWEYRPWGYDTDYTEENRDFPSVDTCLTYCLSQKQIDFIK